MRCSRGCRRRGLRPARRSPPSLTPSSSDFWIAAMVPPETNLASWKRSLIWTIIVLMRLARSPISSREWTPVTRASKLPLPTSVAASPILRIGRLMRKAKTSAPIAAAISPIGDPQREALDHLPDREIGVGLALLDQHRPVDRLREGESAEFGLAVGPRIGLDRDHRRAGLDRGSAVLDDLAVAEIGAGFVEDLPAVGVDDADGAGLLERVVGDCLAQAGRGRSGRRRRPRALATGALAEASPSPASGRCWAGSRR